MKGWVVDLSEICEDGSLHEGPVLLVSLLKLVRETTLVWQMGSS